MRLPPSVLLLLLSVPLAGCVSGDSYPEAYGQAYCGVLFACFEADSVEDLTGWDDSADCKDELAENIRSSPAYDRWEEGDASFDSDAAGVCIDEVSEFRTDADCAGESLNLFNYAAFVLDAAHEDCGAVYPTDE